jgi:hypothetical protein
VPLPAVFIPEIYRFGESRRGISINEAAYQIAPSEFLGAGLLGNSRTEALWNKIALTPFEGDVAEALRLISPGVERLVVKPVDDNSAKRVPFAKLKGLDYPIPLRSLGDGMNRLFAIALAMVNARNGLFLFDEAENGLHHSVQADLWRLIFSTVRRLNVQVFATTHSLDCIRAFEEAARESDEEGVLIHLAREGENVRTVPLDERELAIAVRGNIEVR